MCPPLVTTRPPHARRATPTSWRQCGARQHGEFACTTTRSC
jgi:hypothetical protein